MTSTDGKPADHNHCAYRSRGPSEPATADPRPTDTGSRNTTHPDFLGPKSARNAAYNREAE